MPVHSPKSHSSSPLSIRTRSPSFEAMGRGMIPSSIVHDEFGIERLFLVSRGRRLSIAACLSPDEKADFAKALSSALGEAKRGPTRTVLE